MAEVEWWDKIREARGALSRPALHQRLLENGETQISLASITAYERGIRTPPPSVTRALDKALGTGRRIQDALGHYEPTDLDRDFAKLRDHVAEVDAQLQRLRATVELLSRTVWPPEESTDPSPND